MTAINLPVPADPGGWAHLMRGFLDEIIKVRRGSVYTARNYRQAIEDFWLWLQDAGYGELAPAEVSHQHVRAYIIGRQRDRPGTLAISRRTIRLKISALKAFFRHLAIAELVRVNPFLYAVTPKMVSRLPVVLTVEQCGRLMEAPTQARQSRLRGFFNWRDRLILELLYGGGLRVSEAVGLNYGHIDWDLGTATVTGKGDKQRVCPLGSVAMEVLRKFRDEYARATGPQAPVLVGMGGGCRLRLHVFEVQMLVKKYAAAAGLPGDVTPHTLRHSYATHLLDSGADLRSVQELLGHSSVLTTAHYCHVSTARMKAAHSAAHPRA
jgi:integrase/recombinase XerC